MTNPEEKEKDTRQRRPVEQATISRRGFLKAAAAAAAMAAGVGTASTGCQSAPEQAPARDLVLARVPQPVQYPEVPFSPVAPPPPGPLKFFTPREAATVDAFTARLLPGTPDDPGAREAGVLYYIDNLLSYRDGFAEAIYRDPPYAETYEGDEPPEDQTDTSQVIWIPADEIERYGYQSIYNPREAFRLGLAGLDRFANEQFNANFTDLTEEQQDQIIQAMVDGETTGFEPLSGESFFHAMRRYTNEGMFSDPVYGGNRDAVGWQLIGYPGAQRAYTPEDIQVEGRAAERPIWSLANLPHFHPGEPVGPNTVLPVTGSEERLGGQQQEDEGNR